MQETCTRGIARGVARNGTIAQLAFGEVGRSQFGPKIKHALAKRTPRSFQRPKHLYRSMSIDTKASSSISYSSGSQLQSEHLLVVLSLRACSSNNPPIQKLYAAAGMHGKLYYPLWERSLFWRHVLMHPLLAGFAACAAITQKHQTLVKAPAG
jgi:hypothetical protein